MTAGYVAIDGPIDGPTDRPIDGPLDGEIDGVIGGAIDGVRTIAVLRPNAVGDFVFSLPALHALKHAYPEARLIYLGKQWHADFLRGRPGPIDEVIVLPPCPGITAAPDAEPAQEAAFVAAMREARLDLAIQLFGGGRYSNPLVQRLGARVTAGMQATGAVPLDRSLAYEGVVNRRLQLLEVAALAGAPVWPMQERLTLTPDDVAQAAPLIAPDGMRPLVLIQPGASDARRCWPASHFAAVADALARKGASVAINGSAAEAPLVRSVLNAMEYPAVDLSGRASLGALCGLLGRAALMVSNDTGPLHLALALGTPSVGIYWRTNVIESAPLQQREHRALWSDKATCPICGVENIHVRCSHEVSFVDDVAVDDVKRAASDLLSARHFL